jgi:tryptophanase
MRLAFPRRVFTLSQVEYAIDRLNWLFHNRKLVGGIRFVVNRPSCASLPAVSSPSAHGPKSL